MHGLHGARRPPWKNPGSGDSSWIHELGRQSGRKVMSFGYAALHILSGFRTWESIRRTSIRLLEDLKKARATAAKVCSQPFQAFCGHIILTVSPVPPRMSNIGSAGSADNVCSSRYRRYYRERRRSYGTITFSKIMDLRNAHVLFRHLLLQACIPACTGRYSTTLVSS